MAGRTRFEVCVAIGILLLSTEVVLTAAECRKVVFDPVIEDEHALKNHVIQELTVSDEAVCRIQCYLNQDCKSYNIGPSHKPICQLNDADRYQYPNDYKNIPGYYYRGTQNVCRSNPCSVHGTCQAGSDDHFRCQCFEGYTGRTCDTDINECLTNTTNNCTLHGVCTNLPGTFNCSCPKGHRGDGVTVDCEYINECKLGEHNCNSSTEVCVDLPWPATFHCNCKQGFQKQGQHCVDADECGSSPCDPHNANCNNTPGSYKCTCKPGFTGNGKACYGDGKSQTSPGKTCKEVKENFDSSPDGTYWIDPDGDGDHSDAFTVYCDMTTKSGGWTLVWAYKFTKYGYFNDGGNAVTPTPQGYITGSNPTTTISNTAPQGPHDFNAIKFDLWKSIGSAILIKSNINNGFSCYPMSANIWKRQAVWLSCSILKPLITTISCHVVPDKLKFHACGIMLNKGSMIYFLDTCTNEYWPTHDPCGQNKPKQLKGVANPYGNLFLKF